MKKEFSFTIPLQVVLNLIIIVSVYSVIYSGYKDDQKLVRGRLEVNRSMCALYVSQLNDPKIKGKDRAYMMKLLFSPRYDLNGNGLYCESGLDKLGDKQK